MSSFSFWNSRKDVEENTTEQTIDVKMDVFLCSSSVNISNPHSPPSSETKVPGMTS
jgi:hypothetical protein